MTPRGTAKRGKLPRVRERQAEVFFIKLRGEKRNFWGNAGGLKLLMKKKKSGKKGGKGGALLDA